MSSLVCGENVISRELVTSTGDGGVAARGGSGGSDLDDSESMGWPTVLHSSTTSRFGGAAATMLMYRAG